MSALVQEGEQPPEDPQALLTELDRLLGSLAGLIVSINRTNMGAQLADGTTLTQALAQRDVLKLRRDVLAQVAAAASNRANRYSRSEIRLISTLDIGALRRQMDQLAQAYRERDTAVQAVNWTTDLVE